MFQGVAQFLTLESLERDFTPVGKIFRSVFVTVPVVGSSRDRWRFLRSLRSLRLASFIVIWTSQVLNFASPRNGSMLENAFRTASWVTPSASARLFKMVAATENATL